MSSLLSGKSRQKAGPLAFAVLLLLSLAACGATLPTQSASYEKPARERDIPLALWAGSDWESSKDQALPKVDTLGGENRDRRIRGPFEWKHPKTGAILMVYERTSPAKGGEKRQLFAVNRDGTALGRVFDSRPGQPDRYFVGDALFPLGPWKAGERRRYFVIEYSGDDMRVLEERIRLRKLSFAYDGSVDSLKFDWRQRDESRKVLFDERYIYSPGRGLVDFENRLKD